MDASPRLDLGQQETFGKLENNETATPADLQREHQDFVASLIEKNNDEENFSFDFEQKFSEVTRASMRLRIHNNPQMEQKLVKMKDALFSDLMDCLNPAEGFDVGGSSYVSLFSLFRRPRSASASFSSPTPRRIRSETRCCHKWEQTLVTPSSSFWKLSAKRFS